MNKPFFLIAALLSLQAMAHDPTPTPITAGLQSRSYDLHEPASPIAVVIDMHGGLGSANFRWSVSDPSLLTFSDDEAVVMAFPDGSGSGSLLTWNAGTCCGYAETNNIDDIEFLDALVVELKADYPGLPIYMGGHSNGGQMAYRYLCEGSEAIDGLYSVSGVTAIASCAAQAIPVLHRHGVDDTNSPPLGGQTTGPSNEIHQSVRDSMDNVNSNRTSCCHDIVTSGLEVVETWDCNADMTVRFISDDPGTPSVDEGDHAWVDGTLGILWTEFGF